MVGMTGGEYPDTDSIRIYDARKQWWGFGLYTLIWIAVFFTALRDFIQASWSSNLNSHTVLIPFVSAFYIFQERRTIFSSFTPARGASLALFAGGVAAYGFRMLQGGSFSEQSSLALAIFSAYLFILAGFLFFFGGRAFKEALFPLSFLVFMIPIPEAVVGQIVPFLQKGSAAVTGLILNLLGISYVREDLCFQLSRVSVEIAPECSSIRSSLALLITGTVAARLFLDRWWSRLLFVLITIPLALVKNAIRIVTITLLAQYVDMRFLTDHWLHNSGGFVFFLITLALAGGILLLLRSAEKRGRARRTGA